MEFSSGSHVGSVTANVRISAAKNVDFQLTGDVVETKTGSVAQGANVELPIELSSGDGTKNVMVEFTDEASAKTYASTSVVLDTAAPTVSVSSHADGESVQGTGIALTGSVADAGGIASFTVA